MQRSTPGAIGGGVVLQHYWTGDLYYTNDVLNSMVYIAPTVQQLHLMNYCTSNILTSLNKLF